MKKLFMKNKWFTLIPIQMFNLNSVNKYVLSPFVCNDTLENKSPTTHESET